MSEPLKHEPARELEAAARQKDPGLMRDFCSFLMHNKKWWLIPLLLAFALVGALVMLGGSGLAPFIYSFF